MDGVDRDVVRPAQLPLARGVHDHRPDSQEYEDGGKQPSCPFQQGACHPYLGGAVYSSSPAIGTVAGPNLTRGKGGIGADYSDMDFVRAIRRGVRRDGRSLVVMPSEVFTHLSQEDLGAVIAFLKQVPPVDREVPRSGFGPVGRALLAAGKMNILVAGKTPHITPPASVPADTTAVYGKYLADIAGCHGCHGYGLSGGRVAGPPGLPPASNLTPAGIGSWTEADLARALREGKRPDGSQLDEFMPWKVFRGMTDAEIHAIWLYLRSVPARPFGNK
ncbi:MAG TPA: c-type cytochrome [Gemmatimonadaceae bacterium]|nr:c-type cytochrome [Gemmatimonadaceae bacterium]